MISFIQNSDANFNRTKTQYKHVFTLIMDFRESNELPGAE